MTATAAPAARAPSTDRPGPLVAVAFLVACLLLGLVGLTTIISGTDLAAVWPAAGVAVVWLLVRRAGPFSVDTAMLFGVMLVLGVTADLPWSLAIALPVVHTLQTVVIVELMRRWLPELWGCGGTEPLASPRQLGRYLGCIGGGVLAGTVVGVVWWNLSEEREDVLLALLWFGRNACGVLVLTTALLLLLQYFGQPGPRPRVWGRSWSELVAACLTSLCLYGVVFVGDVQSMQFLLLGVVVWFGVRFGTLTNSMHAVVVAHIVTSATLAGRGPLAEDGPITNALLVQLFVLGTAVTGLALSTGLDERAGLTSRLRQTSDEMTYQAQLMDAVVNSMAEGLAVVDDGGRWLLRNPAATQVGGFAGDLRALLSMSPGGDPLARALAGDTVRDVELRVSDPPGAGRILAVSAAPLPPDSVTGRARALLIFRDATVEHARRVDLMAFAEVVAHDLRNPLAAIESWTEMMALELGDGPPEPALVREYVDRVGTGARRMKGLIEDLLGRATQDSTLQLRRVDVAALAEEVAADHGATDHVKVGDIPDVRADAALVRQVIDNLLGNALKFVPAGAEPSVRVTGRRTDSGTVAIAVADEGVGLPTGAHERIFEQHHRAHTSYDGRGLGLAICRRIVERHGGSITARDAEPGRPDARGAVFEFTLPSPD